MACLIGAMTFSQGQPACRGTSRKVGSLTTDQPPPFLSGCAPHCTKPTRSRRAREALDVVHTGQRLGTRQGGEG